MEKAEFVVNFLREFIVGSELAFLDSQLFRVLQTACSEAALRLPELEPKVVEALPSGGQELDQCLKLADVFTSRRPYFVECLTKAEKESREKSPDLNLTKSEEGLTAQKSQRDNPDEAIASLQ
jgi:hypothetical protein